MRDVASSVLSYGAEVVARVEAVVDLEATARADGALHRVRKVRQASEGGCRFDLLAHLPPGGCAGAAPGAAARPAGSATPGVIARLPPEAAAAADGRLTRRASRGGRKTQAGTRIAAGHLMRPTSLPAETTPAERLVALYRPRRQVELGFKRLKTLGGPGDLPASDPDLARTWLLAQPIGAVLAEDIATSMAAIPSLGRGPGGRRRQ